MKQILLVITGSIAAFKALELARILIRAGFRVKAVLSRGGQEFLTPISVSALTEQQVLLEDSHKMEHITASRNADLIILCPASASFLNKLASGIGGELALDVFLAKKVEVPVLIAPAMNVEMWKNKHTQNAVKNLSSLGYNFISPQNGELLCKEEGAGKLADIHEIFNEALQMIEFSSRLKGKKFLITNGATVEKIDEVRFISNFSSGLQGAVIAKQLLQMGATVFLVEGRVSYDVTLPSLNLHKTSVLSAKEMLASVMKIVEGNKIEGFFAVAAVSDFYVENAVKGKVKKDKMFELKLAKNPDILATIGALGKTRPKKVIGFAAEEAKNLLKNGEAKLKAKNCDAIFANNLCFESTMTEGYILLSKAPKKPTAFKGGKQELAKKLIELIIYSISR